MNFLLHGKDLGLKLCDFVHDFPFGVGLCLSLFRKVASLFMLLLCLLLEDGAVGGVNRTSRGSLDGVSGLVMRLFALNQL